MKRFITIAMVVLFAAVMMMGCASSGGNNNGGGNNSDMPKWVLMPPQAEDAFFGVGQTQKSIPALGMQVADQRASAAIVLAVKSKVSAMVRDFMEETKIGDQSAQHEFAQAVSEQVGSMTLQGVKIVERHRDGNTWYSLAKYSVGDVNNAVMDMAKENAKKKKELYEKFIAQQGFDLLEKKLQTDMNGLGGN